MPKGERPPIPSGQKGLSKPPEQVAGKAPGRDEVAMRDAVTPHDTAATQEQLSIEKLKAELFDREVPEEHIKLIEAGGGDFARAGDFSNFDSCLTASIVGYAVPHKPPEQFSEEDLTEFGKLLRAKMHGNNFIDLGAGFSLHSQTWAENFGAKQYIGVDVESYRAGTDREQHPLRRRAVPLYFIQDDMLSFVSKLQDEIGAVYFLSAIEPVSWRNRVSQADKEKEVNYTHALGREISRTMKKGDLLLLGPTTYLDLGIKDTGLRRLEEFRSEHEVRVFIKE